MIAVCGHTRRRVQALQLSKRLNAGLVLDNGSLGSNVNHDRAWRFAAEGRGKWALVVEDDAVPVEDFGAHAAQMLMRVPGDGIVSFYMGTSYPIHVQTKYRKAVRLAEKEQAGWIKGDAVNHGVAIAIRTEVVPDMLDYVQDIDKPYDERLSVWARARGLPCWYTFPSLVDHEDSDPVLPASKWQPRDKARRAWRTGAPLNKSRFVDM